MLYDGTVKNMLASLKVLTDWVDMREWGGLLIKYALL